MEYEVLATVHKGQIVVPDAFHEAVALFPDGDVILSLRRAYATRSKLQNRYYWGALVDPIANHCGMSPADLHEALKQKFLPVNVVWHGNGVLADDGVVIGGTTTTLSIRQFGDYCDAIRVWAAEFLLLDLEAMPDDGQ